MEVIIDRQASEPLWQQIYRQIADRIQAGQLPSGTRLPPERLLAAQLGVNRTTVVQAYRELAADGLVEARVGSGTRVAPLARTDSPGPDPGWSRSGPGPDLTAAYRPLDWATYLAGQPAPEDGPLLREARAIRTRPDMIHMASGELAPELVPAAVLTRLMQEAITAPGAWGYGPSAGWGPLREAIAARLRQAAATTGGRGLSPDQVVITAGAQQALMLVVRALVEPGDAVAVESPSYYRCLTGLFTAAGARVLPVPTDREGLRPDALEQLLHRHRLRAVLTIPTYQNPTGVTMPLARRRELLALAARYQVPLIEDDIYGDLGFGPQPPSLLSMDPGGLVIQVGSFSKSVAAGLRMGWVAAPAPLAERVAALKSQLEPGSGLVPQWAMAEMIRRGWLETHLQGLRQALRERRDLLVAALERHLPQCQWQMPDGGLHLWVEPPAGQPALAWFRAAVQVGVAVMPGEVYGAGRGSPSGLRLNFSFPPREQMDEAVRRLARALRKVRRELPAEAQAGGALV